MRFIGKSFLSIFILSATHMLSATPMQPQEEEFNKAATTLIARAKEVTSSSEDRTWRNPSNTPRPENDPIKLFLEKALPYLTRPFSQDLLDEKGNLQISDQEHAVYHLTALVPALTVPYRSAVFNDTLRIYDEINFRTDGTPKNALTFPCSTDVTRVFPPQDIYHIHATLLDFELSIIKDNGIPLNAQFALFSNHNDGHATTMLAVLDPTSKTVLSAFFINSWDKAHEAQYMAEKFNDRYGQRVFGAVAKAAKERNLPKTVYHPQQEVATIGHYTPFIDASLPLQLATDDQNCTLYMYNMIQALLDALTDTSFSTTLHDMAQKIYDNRNPDAQMQPETEQTTAARNLIHNQLKTRLTQYYDADSNRRSDQELRDYHDKMRWDLGSAFFQKLAQ